MNGALDGAFEWLVGMVFVTIAISLVVGIFIGKIISDEPVCIEWSPTTGECIRETR